MCIRETVTDAPGNQRALAITMLRAALLLFAINPLCGQTAAGMLGRLDGISWEAPPTAACAPRILAQMDIYATAQWTRHCADTRGGMVREDFFYVLGEPARLARLRVDIVPVDESPENTARLLPALQRMLTARFGTPAHEPEMMEIGFRPLRYGQPVAGDHWQSGGLHYFLHTNLSGGHPMAIRRGVQLVVITDRLFAERTQDALIQRAEGFGGPPPEGDQEVVRARLKARIGAPYVHAMEAEPTTSPDRARLVRDIIQDLTAILREADRADAPRRALCLLAADAVANKLSDWLIEPSPQGERETAAAAGIRRQLAPYGVKLGGMTHYGGLAYGRELLWRVWRESPETEAGELAFLELQRLGWYTGSGEGCPANPDLFREVISRAEAFLAAHPHTDFRRQVLYALAVAHESWWSIAHAPADDEFVNAPPYPRRTANAREAGRAREEAIRYYREVVALAPGTPEAASALRRLPRLELGIETGQRRFFCSYC